MPAKASRDDDASTIAKPLALRISSRTTTCGFDGIRPWPPARLALPLRFAPWKTGLSARVLTTASAVGVIRTAVDSRLGIMLMRAQVAKRHADARDACEAGFALTRVTGLKSPGARRAGG